MRFNFRAARPLRLVLCIIVVLACVGDTFAQESGAITGTVRDAEGHPAAGATVSLLDASGVVVRDTSTNPRGEYAFQAVKPGTYRVRATFGSAAGETSATAPSDHAIEVKLTPSTPSSADTAFFDQPTFTVAGVTDTSSLAIHGSADVAHQKDALSKEVINLAELPLSAAPASPHSPAFTTAEKLIAAKEYAKAHDVLTQDLKREDNSSLRRLLGDVNEQLGDPVQAVREYRRAAELDPSEVNFLRWGAEFLLHHAPDPAIEIFTEGTHRFSASSRMLTAMGVAYYIRGSYEQATELLCRASDLDPRATEPYLFLGRIAELEPTISPSSLEHLARFVHDSPHDAQANYYYAIALEKQRNSAARAYFEKAIQLDPNFAAAYLQLGILLQNQGKLEQARNNLRRAADLQPNLADAHFRLAQLYRKQGNEAQSRAELAKYQQLASAENAQAERERHEIQQFVLATRSSTQQ